MGKEQSFQHMMLGQLDINMQKNEIGYHFDCKTNSKQKLMDYILKNKTKTIRLLDMKPKAQETNKK